MSLIKPLRSVQSGEESYSSTATASPSRKLLSSLPLLRFTTLTILLVSVDSLLSISLWIAGGNSAYLEGSVEDFTVYQSTFDLAMIAAIRGIVLIACLYYLEHHTLVSVSSKLEKTQLTSRRLAWLCHGVLLLLPFATMGYAIVKVSLIFSRSLGTFRQLHIAYKILCIVGVVTPGLELLLGALSFYFMWRLIRVLKLRLLLQEDDAATAEPEKKADFKRLAILAIPVCS